MNRYDYIGKVNTNNQGLQMIIVDYHCNSDVEVIFDGYENKPIKCRYSNFKRGAVKNPYYPEVFGVGYKGENFKISDIEKSYERKIYSMWHGMLERCYSEKSQVRNKTKSYKGCTVCDEWLCYANFREWVINQENFIFWCKDKYGIDKDIINKNNKVYCSDYCCLVPHYINNLFTNHRSHRGEYPIGVSINCYNTFTVSCNDINGKTRHFGNFKTPEDAFMFYKNYKENIIQTIAKTEFADRRITEKCYIGMMKCRIEIDD